MIGPRLIFTFALCLQWSGIPGPSNPVAAASISTLPEYGVPLSPEETRNMRDQIARLSRDLGLSQELIAAIAKVLGLKTPKSQYSFAKFIGDVGAKANEGKALFGKLVELKTEVGRLSDPVVRDPGLKILALAQAALSAGRIEEAEQKFGELTLLRNSESENAQDLWLKAVELAAQTATLRLDEDRATEIWDNAGRQFEKKLATDRRGKFKSIVEAAAFQYSKGLRLLQGSPLVDAKRRYEAGLMAFPEQEFPNEWGILKRNLGNLLVSQGIMLGGPAANLKYSNAIELLNAALGVQEAAVNRKEWAQTQNSLGIAFFRQGELVEGKLSEGLFAKAITAYQNAQMVNTKEISPVQWTDAQTNIALVYHIQGQRLGGAGGIDLMQKAARPYEEALPVYALNRNFSGWAATQNNLAGTFAASG